MFNFSKGTILFLLIILLAAFLRLYQLSSIPGSLTIDELAIGYNSYSLLHTGTDEFGKFLPITYASFGDWKLIGYPLLDTIFIAIFGLNEFAVRFPSALAGIVQVILIFFLVRRLFPKQKLIGYFAALFYALSPWSIYFSRMTFEDNVATACFLAGVLTFIHFIEEKKTKHLIFTAILFASTVFTYHAYDIFMPIFAFVLAWQYRKHLSISKATVVSSVIFLLVCLIVFLAIRSTNFQKLQTITVFNDPNVIYNRSDNFKTDGSHEPAIVQKLFYNKYIPGVYQTAENYLATFSPSFLFDKGGQALMSDLGYFGEFYIIDALFLFIGIAALFYKREKYIPLLLIWLATAPIASAITADAPASTRLLMLLPLLIIVEAYGGYTLISYVRRQKFAYVYVVLLLLLYIWNVAFFMDGYFGHINYQRAVFLHYGYKQAVDVAKTHPNDRIVMTGPNNFPYISFLFYTQYDPKKFQTGVTYYPRSDEFILVKHFDRYSFVDSIDYNHLQKNIVYIDGISPKAITDPKLVSSQGTISTPSGVAVFHWFVMK